MYFPVGAVCQDVQGRTCPPVFSFLKLWPVPPTPEAQFSALRLSASAEREKLAVHII